MITSFFFISIAQCFPPECENFCPYGRVRDSNGCQTCKCKPPSKSMVLFLYTSILKDSFIQPLLYCIYDSPWSQHEDFHVLWNYFNIDETLCLTCIHVYMGVGTGGGVPFFCLIFFFDESFNSFNLLLTPLCMICWMIMFCGKRTKLMTRRYPIWIRQGVLLINFLKKNNAIVLCFWYKIVPWMISLCRTP